MQNLRPKILALLLTFLSSIGLALFTIFFLKNPAVSSPIVEVTKGTIIEQAEAVGNIKTRNFSTVKSQVDGIVETIYHDEGEYVTKGTPLVKIRPAPSSEQYAEAHKNLAEDRIEENHAEMNLKRFQHLLKSHIITTNDHEYTDAIKAYDKAKNKRILSEEKLALLKNEETTIAGKSLANTVESPVDGYVLHRQINVGDPVMSIASAQTATSLFIIANMTDLTFQGSVDERDAAKITTGMTAKIKIGSLPDQELTGTIKKIALQSDKENLLVSNNNHQSESNSNSPFNVGFKIEIDDLQIPKNLILRSGYSATASITIKKIDNILILPMRVIHFKDTKPYVLLPSSLKKEEKPKEQSIETGISDGINIEIKSGLKLGDKVIDEPDTTVVTQNK
jgi:HlyD family secretion protein